jgi:predicted Zn-dependent peptidase
LELKRLDTLNSFVFNVDTKAELVQAYSRYALRGEPLDTLSRIQDAFFTSRPDELQHLARRWLDPRKIQLVVVADKTIPVSKADGQTIRLEDDLKVLSQALGLSFEEIPLR